MEALRASLSSVVTLTPTEGLSLLFGGLLIVMYSFRTFNQPGYRLDFFKADSDTIDQLIKLGEITPKSLSSLIRYRFFSLVYMFISLILFGFLCFIWEHIELDIIDTNFKESQIRFFIIALIITGVLPNIPIIDKIVDGIKSALHNQAKIPSIARNVFYLIKSNPIDKDKLKLAIKHSENLFEPNFFDEQFIGDVLSFQRLWLRYIHLYGLFNNNQWKTLLITSHLEEPFSYSIITAEHNKLKSTLFSLKSEENADFSDAKIIVLTQLKRLHALVTYSIIKNKQPQNETQKILKKWALISLEKEKELLKTSIER